MSLRAIILCGAGALLAGCSLTPEYQRPETGLAPHWRSQPARSQPASAVNADTQWRKVFTDPELQRLIELALDHNKELKTAVARIDASRARLGLSQAEQLPGLNIGGSLQRSRTSAADSPFGQTSTAQQGQLGLMLTSFELDLWGRLRAQTDAARQQWLASGEDALSVQLSLVGEVASSYYEMRTYQQTEDVISRLSQLSNEARRLVRQRYEQGLASELDLQQAQTLTHQLGVDAAENHRSLAVAMNTLQLLVGTALDRPRLLATAAAEQWFPASVNPGLPSELLVRRPDIRASEARLKAANADVGAARAAFLPSLSLTGSMGGSSPQLSQLFSGAARSWTLAPQLAIPLLDVMGHRSRLDESRAQFKVLAAEYQGAVEQAFREVAEALDAGEPIDRKVRSQQHLVAAETRRVELATVLYREGMTSFLDVLDAQRSLSTARQTLLRFQLMQAHNRVSLFKSIGGGWS